MTFDVKGQYERKARNVMLKIDQCPEIITANRKVKLKVNGQAVPDCKFALLFRCVFSRTHDMEKPGINQFLGALCQIGVHVKELSGRLVREAYGSPLPLRENAAARSAAFRGRVPAGVGGDDDDGESPKPDEELFVTPVGQRPRYLAAVAAAATLSHGTNSAATTS